MTSNSYIPNVDHVGSMVRPAELVDAWHAWESGHISADELLRHQDNHIRGIIKFQESLGLKLVTDGEFRRSSWSKDFVEKVDGMEWRPSYLTFRRENGATFRKPAPYAAGKVRRTRSIVADDYRFLKANASAPPKVTIPGPTYMQFGFFDDCADRSIYPDLEDYWSDLVAIYRAEIGELAEAGCRYLQIDDPSLMLIFDDSIASVMAEHGCADPMALLMRGINATNDALAGRPREMTVSLHLCQGNSNQMWLGKSGYARCAEAIFSMLDVDYFLLEYDTPRAGDFSPLQYLPAGKKALLGLISTKDPGLEERSSILRRIDEAAQFAPINRLGLCPQCGFGSSGYSSTWNPMTTDIQAEKLRLLIDIGKEVWSGI
jgi:5-methyltetrahydropteroyltriglutamate--homocysteine methyltransferase